MKVAMLITGHTTTSTFMRYQVVPADDVAEALLAVEAFVPTRAEDKSVLPFKALNGSKNRAKAHPKPPGSP